MPRYLLSVNHSAEIYNGSRTYQAYDSQEEMQQAFADTAAFNERLEASGCMVFVGGLEAPDSATTVDGQGDEVTVRQGPYSPSNDSFIGGFWVIDALDRASAEDLAAQASRACRSPVEVRPFAGE